MILNNYYNFIGNVPRYNYKIGDETAFADIGLKDTSGSSVNWQYGCFGSLTDNPRVANNLVAWKELSVILASDEGDPAASDYNVTSNNTGSFNLTTTFTSGAEDGKATLTVTISGTCVNPYEQTIRQICIAKKVWQNANSDEYVNVMLIKHKLDEPIVVAFGASFTKTFSWDLS